MGGATIGAWNLSLTPPTSFTIAWYTYTDYNTASNLIRIKQCKVLVKLTLYGFSSRPTIVSRSRLRICFRKARGVGAFEDADRGDGERRGDRWKGRRLFVWAPFLVQSFELAFILKY